MISSESLGQNPVLSTMNYPDRAKLCIVRQASEKILVP